MCIHVYIYIDLFRSKKYIYMICMLIEILFDSLLACCEENKMHGAPTNARSSLEKEIVHLNAGGETVGMGAQDA